MKKVLTVLAVILFIIAVAIISPWKAIGDKLLGLVGLSLNSPVSISVSSKQGEMIVYLNDKERGTTPLEIDNLDAGTYKIKLEKKTDTPEFYTTFERTLDVEEGTQIVINWELGPSEEFSSGEVYFFKKSFDKKNKKSSISVIPHPEDVTVYFDNAKQAGPTYVINDVEEGRHKIKLEKPGYLASEVDIQVKENYDLFLEARLFSLPINIE